MDLPENSPVKQIRYDKSIHGFVLMQSTRNPHCLSPPRCANSRRRVTVRQTTKCLGKDLSKVTFCETHSHPCNPIATVKFMCMYFEDLSL